MESADTDRKPSGDKGLRKIDCPRKLIRLHTDETNQGLATGLADFSDDPIRPHPPIGFIISVQTDFNLRSKHVTTTRILR
jgi:hypothetical protein